MHKDLHFISNSDKTTKVKRIAFVGNTSFSLYNFRIGVMRSFKSQGFEIFAIAPVDQYSDFFKTEGIQHIPIKIDCKGTNLFNDIKLICKLINIYKKNRIDFIFHYTIKPVIYGSLACDFLKIPSIAVTTGLGYTFLKNDFLNKIVSLLYKFSLRHVLDVWFLNSNDRETFIKRKIVKPENTYILHGEGIDTEYFSQKQSTAAHEKTTFLLLSRLIKEKGIEEYAKAAAKLRDKGLNVECLLLGKAENDNPENISIEKVMKWHNAGMINFIGESIDVRKYILNSDCVVLPSYYKEGVPRCLMEAMSMQRPIITTNNVGCIELIVDKVNGLICEPRNVEDLASKMEEMHLATDEVRKSYGINGRKRILDFFDEKIIIRQYHEKFNSLLKTNYDKRFHSVIQPISFRNKEINKNFVSFRNSFRSFFN